MIFARRVVDTSESEIGRNIRSGEKRSGGRSILATANYDLFLKLKAEGHKTIWFVSALLHNGSVGGINHAFLLDGDIVIDHSQFQEKSLCAHRYFTANKVVKYDVWDKCPPSPEALRARAGLGQYSHSGSIRLGPSTRQLAMRKIINL